MFNKPIHSIVISLLISLTCIHSITGQDSIRKLSSVDIVDFRPLRMSITAAPTQILNNASLQYMHTSTVADAVKHFSGVNVKDFGGIGGLKTVSIRSLGAAQTAVSYDGITISDAQNGQVDLGKITTGGVAQIALVNGSFGDLLQPARTYAAASLLNISTNTPSFVHDQNLKVKLGTSAGSFGFVNIFTNIYYKYNNWLFSTSGKTQKSDGNYTFMLSNGSISTKETRTNSDMQDFHIEENISYRDTNQEFIAKLYYYESERGLPGVVILYNTYSAQRLSDKNYFGQAFYKYNISKYTKISFAGKYNYTYTHYIDTAYVGGTGKTEHEYLQNEAYFSTGISQRIIKNLYFSIVSDYTWNNMEADIYAFPKPVRQVSQSVVNIKYTDKIFDIHGNILYTYMEDYSKSGGKTKTTERFSPAICFSAKPFNNNLQFRLFFKETYRMPTFNELYYTDYGNYALQPEISEQIDLGITYFQYFNEDKWAISVSGDIYHNKVRDKIIAIPGRNLFLWTMKNIGEVEITGIDIVGKFTSKLSSSINFHMESSYTFQNAVDVTNPDSRIYGDQIPYTPRHSASSSLGIENPWISIDYNILYSGKRYTLPENIVANELKSYIDQSISLCHNFKFRKWSLYVCGEILNLADTQYEIVNYYPMPGRSYKITININF